MRALILVLVLTGCASINDIRPSYFKDDFDKCHATVSGRIMYDVECPDNLKTKRGK